MGKRFELGQRKTIRQRWQNKYIRLIDNSFGRCSARPVLPTGFFGSNANLQEC